MNLYPGPPREQGGLEKIPYSGKFSLVQIFAKNPVSPPEEIIAVLIFAFSASY